MEILGYSQSGGDTLCPEHAQYGDLPDEGNETGYVSPIFSTDELSSDLTCDECPLDRCFIAPATIDLQEWV
ncbi:MAG: hypothetical protein JO202_19395 [Ktedonobacteraceae bacterium]|nr:hypothetical protein [Ktedonobacteraceae bacterium]